MQSISHLPRRSQSPAEQQSEMDNPLFNYFACSTFEKVCAGTQSRLWCHKRDWQWQHSQPHWLFTSQICEPFWGAVNSGLKNNWLKMAVLLFSGLKKYIIVVIFFHVEVRNLAPAIYLYHKLREICCWLFQTFNSAKEKKKKSFMSNTIKGELSPGSFKEAWNHSADRWCLR